MKIFKFFTLLPFLFLSQLLFAQNTVGVLKHDASQAFEGYNVHFPHNQPNVYLLDNCGRQVHVWTDSAQFRPGNVALLMEDGRLVKAKREASIMGDVIWAGGGGEYVEIRDWDNNLLWSYGMNDSLGRLHHDIAVLPNGNVLVIAWERKTMAEALAVGRRSSLLPDGELWSEQILEIKPIGTDSFEVVWEWHVWDHLIQDLDTSIANYGKPTDHPERIDINYLGSSNGSADWLHFNSIDFNVELDQIVLSVPTFNELWIIDHSTSTSQAAGGMGGFSGKGGDLMYRWGNPLAYGKGDSSHVKLGYQHDVHWIDFGLMAGAPDFGKIMIFNNRIGADYSTVNIINPLFDTYEWEYLKGSDSLFTPADFDWTYSPTPATDMYSNILSGAQRLPNGNTLICVGRPGRSFEINANEEIVWEFVNPLVQGSPLTQGDPVVLSSNLNFRLDRYPLTYGAFAGRDLTPGPYLELNPDTSICDAAMSLELGQASQDFLFYPNPATELLTLELMRPGKAKVELIDLNGRILQTISLNGRQAKMDISGLAKGIYGLRVDEQFVGKLMVK